MFSIFGPYETFKSKSGAITVRDDNIDLLAAELENLDKNSEEFNQVEAELKVAVNKENKLKKKLSLRRYKLTPETKASFFDIFDWSWKSKTIFSAVCIVCILLGYILSAPSFAINRENPLMFANMKPGSYTVEYDEEGNVVSYKLNKTAKRTVNDAIPTSPEEQKALAYKLYQIGNKAMVASPYAAYYEIGKVESTLEGLGMLPLDIETIDIRNNTTGEHFRQTYQNLESGAELPLMVKFMGAFSVIAKRWYVTAGDADSTYISTIKYDKESAKFDWSSPKDNMAMNEARQAIALHPIPYTASGYKGKINGLDKTEPVEPTGTYWQYDAETGYSLPYYVDGAGRTIGFEKTDQHICYDPEDDYFTTIETATVTYNAEEGYYEVTMKMDRKKEYTHIDTLWALRDDEGSKDASSRFTKFEVRFQLWDNGYYKEWEMWEDWKAPKAYGFVTMNAVQKYITVFSYDENDMDFSELYTPEK